MATYPHRDVLSHAGILHKVRIVADQITFDGEAPIPLGFIGLQARLGYTSQPVAVCKNGANDHATLVKRDGTIIDLGVVMVGNWAGAIGPSGDIFVQTGFIPGTDPFVTDLRVFNEFGGELPSVRALYSSVGIHYVDDHNVPVMATTLGYETIQGVDKCVLPMASGGAIGAQCDKYTNSGAVIFRPDGTKAFYNHYIDRYVFIATNGTETWAALQGFDTPEPGDYSGWVQDAPPVPGYNPKQDLIKLRTSMEEDINEIDRIIALLA